MKAKKYVDPSGLSGVFSLIGDKYRGSRMFPQRKYKGFQNEEKENDGRFFRPLLFP